MQSIAIDAEFCSCFGLYVFAGGHHLGDQFSFHSVDDLSVQVIFLRASQSYALLHKFERKRFQIGRF